MYNCSMKFNHSFGYISHFLFSPLNTVCNMEVIHKHVILSRLLQITSTKSLAAVKFQKTFNNCLLP